MSEARWKWQEFYLEAFLDTNPQNLASRVAVAEKAIYLRTEELRTSTDGQAEWRAIAEAISGLAILKKEIKTSQEAGAEQAPQIGRAARARAN
jgi:thymidylate synthase ThyX